MMDKPPIQCEMSIQAKLALIQLENYFKNKEMKAYILLKDLPNISAGEEFKELKGTNLYQHKKSFYSYPNNIVESNKDWFRLKEDDNEWIKADIVISAKQGYRIEIKENGLDIYYRYVKVDKPTVLFKTEDGFDIKEFDEYYTVYTENDDKKGLYKKWTARGEFVASGKTSDYNFELFKYFKHKSNAIKYIIENKECLSYKEIKQLGIISVLFRDTITDYIKQKCGFEDEK